MIYRNFQDLKLSALGMGAMRLPVINGDDARVDEARTEEMIDYAMSHGDIIMEIQNLQLEGHCTNIRETVFSWQINFRDMTCPIWIKWKKYLKSN